jgi:3-oxoadipate enol-lactonase
MGTLQRDGATIHWEAHGKGPVILLGHSLLADGAMWEDIVPELAKTYRVLIPDARGHRYSVAHRGFSLNELAQDWLAILNKEGVGQAIVGGLSMGGMTAMRLAHFAPARVSRLMLLDTRAGGENPTQRLKYRLMARAYRRFGLTKLLDDQVMTLMFGRDTRRDQPELVDRHRQRILKHDPEQIFHAVRAVANRRDMSKHLPALRMPSLVLVGDQDRATPPNCSRKINQLLPHASFKIIEGCGHLSAVEKPGVVLEHMLDFLHDAGA